MLPPRPEMPLIRRERMRPSAGERMARAMAMMIARWGDDPSLPFVHRIEVLAEQDWSSATFVGLRARIMVTYPPCKDSQSAVLGQMLTAADYRIGAHLIADMTTDARTGGMMVDVLLLEVH